MEAENLIKQARRIIDAYGGTPSTKWNGIYTEALEFFRVYVGGKSSFFINLNIESVRIYAYTPDGRDIVIGTLEAFIRYVENDLLEGMSLERKVQIDVVSDFLAQADDLLNSKKVHPAAPTVIIGASLEEFLRNWIEEAGLDLEGQKPSIDSYAKVLREAEQINKQDIKDITSWGGLRNYAAHGGWDQVSNRDKISLMLDGVNLFMRKYGERST